MAKLFKGAMTALVSGALMVGGGLPAQAAVSSNSTVAAMEAALELAGDEVQSNFTPLANVTLPAVSSSPLNVDGLLVDLPGAGRRAFTPVSASGLKLYLGSTADGYTLGLQRTEDGARALVTIHHASAPKAYEFDMGASVGTLVSAREFGLETDDVLAYDKSGTLTAVVESPWAFDANGVAVPTHYEISGTTITQVVDFDPAVHAFPITADPNWLKIAKCAGAIAIALGSAIVPGGAIVRFISKVGSIKKAATIFVRALKAAKPANRDKAIRNLLLSVGGSLTGVGLIVDKCSP